MRFMVKFNFPVESGNDVLGDPEFGEKLQEFLSDVKADGSL